MEERAKQIQRPRATNLLDELIITTARSGSAGGQHVNKVETKVVIKWNVKQSLVITELQKGMIVVAHKSKVTKAGEIIIVADGERSQLRNKVIALKKLDKLLAKAFLKKKPRIATQPSKAAKRKRLDQKKLQGEKKAMRRKIV